MNFMMFKRLSPIKDPAPLHTQCQGKNRNPIGLAMLVKVSIDTGSPVTAWMGISCEGNRTELWRAQPLTGHVSTRRVGEGNAGGRVGVFRESSGRCTSIECCVMATRCGRTICGLVTHQASGTPGGGPGGVRGVLPPPSSGRATRPAQALPAFLAKCGWG